MKNNMTIDNAFVEQANRTNATGFGDESSCIKDERLRIEMKHKMLHDGLKAYFKCDSERRVVWTINGDGTVTSEHDRLMWVQAPWGTRWLGGSKFSGEPCQLSWLDATRLFGRGTSVELSESGTIALSASQIGSTSASLGYSRGSCRITFAGYSDWRLPTVAEWHTAIGLEWEKCQIIFPRYDADERYWTATGRKEPFLEAVPGFILKLFRQQRIPIAWVGNLGRSILDCGIMEEYPIMFVRTT